MKVKKSKIYLINQAERRFWQKKVQQILTSKEQLLKGSFRSLVKDFYAKRSQLILKLTVKRPTPFYLFDEQELTFSIQAFKRAFNQNVPSFRFYYAIKANWHPYILKTVVKQGFGLDVSSSRELKLGLKAGAKQLVFSGPGKTAADLKLALLHQDKVIVYLDSFQELDRLGRLVANNGAIKAGVRIFTKTHGPWSKFGIPLDKLKLFCQKAKNYPNLKLAGIQSHLSWNKDAGPYQSIIRDIARYLRKNFNNQELANIKFIDLGGGFLPYQMVGYFPWGTVQGGVIQKASEYLGLSPSFLDRYYITEAVTLDSYAQGIALAIKQYLRPLVSCLYFTEPGRIICHQAMHIVMKVIDVKSENSIILDGGVNLVGWEGLRYDYLPLINLTHFSPFEKDCRVYGNLCMADDIWGYNCYAKRIKVGDIIVVPYQGAYTYSLAQNFIKEIPPVYKLK